MGPRFERPKSVEKMQTKLKFYNRRFMIRPGIFGWESSGAIEGSLTEQKERFKKELFYLENMSLMFDFRTVIRSLARYLFPKG